VLVLLTNLASTRIQTTVAAAANVNGIEETLVFTEACTAWNLARQNRSGVARHAILLYDVDRSTKLGANWLNVAHRIA
jgi:hypothetical protein